MGYTNFKRLLYYVTCRLLIVFNILNSYIFSTWCHTVHCPLCLIFYQRIPSNPIYFYHTAHPSQHSPQTLFYPSLWLTNIPIRIGRELNMSFHYFFFRIYEVFMGSGDFTNVILLFVNINNLVVIKVEENP